MTMVDVPRCYKPTGFKELKSIELHHFADVSTEGYGTASYLCLTDSNDNVHCTLVMGKSRVAPLKTVAVPRLELTAAVLAVKVDKQIRKELELPLGHVVFWTDSTIVLRYLRNTSSRFQTFVANRLQVIHDNTTPSQWRHVPTNMNPADLASRGIHDMKTDRGWLQVQQWFKGPQFLWQEENNWPEQPKDLPEVEVTNPEVKRENMRICHSVVLSNSKIPIILNQLLDQPSSWYRLQKTVAWLLRFKKYLCTRFVRGQMPLCCGPLRVEEISCASEEIIKLVQRDSGLHFTDQQTSNRLAKLSPIIDKGVVRVGGRLDNAPLDSELKHPAILPADHHVRDLSCATFTSVKAMLEQTKPLLPSVNSIG